jgi:hypothetical protein
MPHAEVLAIFNGEDAIFGAVGAGAGVFNGHVFIPDGAPPERTRTGKEAGIKINT